MPRPARRTRRAPKTVGRRPLRRFKPKGPDWMNIPMVASMVRAMTAPMPGNTPMARSMPIPGRIALAAGNYLIGKQPVPAVKRRSARPVRKGAVVRTFSLPSQASPVAVKSTSKAVTRKSARATSRSTRRAY